MRFVTWLLTYAAGLAVAAWLLDGIWFEGASSGQEEIQDKILPLLIVSLILGLVSTFIEPVIKVLSLPFIILTLGFLLLVINALMLLLTARLADAFDLGFHVDGFWNALVGSLIVTIVGWGVRSALPARD
ncbi:phage holin family protein [Nocardioides hwasunensis]|uniref:Phage holin family protein n=1 Tax=Nocardioides hwasunensis TaxID=397258 RepID=A0ABR8MKT0_9ACTN|nr:phage holin family protein [Nocardioides hwasunensis]MBD3916631.1 phage holin family protein [Nocardioides hwasunensis]